MKRNFTVPLLFMALSVGVGAKTMAQARTDTPPAPEKAGTTDPMASDARLNRVINFRCEKAKISDILMELRAYTSARLNAVDDWGSITLHISKTSVRDILDGIAALRHGVWKREGDKWILSLPKSAIELAFHPGNAEEAQEAARQRAFLEAANKLPQEIKNRMAFPILGDAYGGVMLSELPENMRTLAQSIYQYERPDAQNIAEGQEKLPATLPDCKIHLLHSSNINVDGKTVGTAHHLIMDVGTVDPATINQGVQAQIFTQTGPNPDYSVVPRSEVLKQKANETVVWPEEPKKSREKALAEDKRMNLPITLNMDRVSFLTAIGTLARAANISVATRMLSLDDNLRTFHFNKTPLHEALDQIAAAYGLKTDGYDKIVPADKPEPDYADVSPEVTGRRIIIGGKLETPHSSDPTLIEWGWRKSGIFLFTPLSPSQSKVYLDAKEKIAKTLPADSMKPASPSK